jgi:pilin isopeptide linkage protein
MKGYDKDNDVYYDELLGEDTSEYAVDKALDKGMLSGQQPSASNNYTAGFYIDINPDSDNAYQLKSLKVGDTFTVRDTLSKSLLLDIDNVNIYQTVEAAKTDITSSCKLSYNVKTGVFEIEVPVTNTKATYRMEYYAKVIGASGAKITISNSAIVLGTDVKEDNVKKNVYVPSISEDADAITSEIRFVKYDQYDVESRVKATFDLYYYDKTAKAWVLLTGEGGYDQIKTGEDGTASINNTTIVASQPIRMVTRGYWYKLVEVDTEEGYMVDSTPIYYYVMNGTALPTDATSVVGYTKYSLVELPAVGASTAELPIIYASNHKLSFNISKLDSGTLSNITGAEFTLYSDRECTQVLDVQEDEKGIISFNDIAAPLDTTLYMKETKTPTGYIDSEAVYEVTFEKGYITKATAITDEGEEALSSKDTTERSVLTVKNDAINGRIRVSKTVNAYTTALKSRDEFSFSLKLYDENGNLVDKTFPAVKTDAQGNETETTVRNGVVFTLANGENLYVYDITPGTTYRIEEIADNRYTVSGNIVDKKGNDSKSISSTGIASGTVETGGYDEVQYTNTLLRSMEIVKKCVTDRGEALDIPDGHEIIITTSSTSSTSGIKVIATWDAQQKKYIATYLSSSTMSFDNSIENGFKVEGLSNGYLYVYEKNADIDGYGYALTYNSSATSTSYVSSSYEYIKVSSVNSGAETYLNMLNTYTDNYVEQEVGVDKTLENGKLKAEQFEFTLSEKLPGATAFVAVDTLTNDKAGNISFNRKYTSKDVGDWIYKLSENLPSGAKYSNGVYTYQGVQYDRESLYIKVTVALEEENGKLQVSEPVFVNSSGTEAEDVKKEFVNTYKASGSIKLTGTKKSENRSSSDKYTFTVTEYDKNYENPLKDAEGNLITATGKTTSGISKNATADITFNSIKYTETDIGVHYYIVTEDIPETADENNCLDGFTYDTSQFKVKVTVTDNGDGTLSAVTSYEKDKEGKDINIAFVNTYEAEGSVTLAGTKTLTYRDIAEDEYGFTVTEYTNASRTTIKKNSKGVAITYDAGVEAATMDNSTQKSTANITFPEISYKLSAGDVGTHYYKVTENIPSDAKNNMKAGVTYSTKSYNVTVVVSDNGKGALNTTVTYNSGNILFENSYQASGSIQFTGIKTLMGRALSAQEFNFEVYTTITYANGITQTSDTATAFGYNNADGSIYFPVLSYTQADIGNKYEYVIQETLPDRPSSAYKEGVTYSSEIYTVTVDVQDATKGELNLVTTVTNSDGEEIKSSTDKGAVKLDFTNLYNAENKLTFTATKFLEGRTIEAEQFTFGIYENDQLVATGTNDADGNIEFEPISYYIRSTATSVEKYIGQHTYVIKEVIPEVRASGYDYDTTQYEVSVNAADNGNGTISLTVTGAALLEEDTSQTVTGSPTSDTITYSVTKAEDKKGNFNNTYGAKGSITFAGSKTLEGRTLDKGEFTFEAVEYKIVEDERTATGNVYTGTNDADGNISFETISYIQNGSRKDTGNYVYVVTEVVPEQEKLGGVTYDKETSYEVQVVVTDKGDGTLETMASANYKSLDFTNIYEASGSLEMDITKKVVEATGQTYNDKNTDGTYMNNIFEFDIYDVEEEDSLLEILYAGAGKTVKASTFNYTLADVGLHTYKLVEKNTENPGYTFDDTVYYVNVLVEDNRDGTLKLSLTDDKGEAIGDVTGNQAEYSITFTNTYSAAGSVTFEGSKAVSHQADMLSAYELGNGDFKFNVYDVTGTADTRDISVEGRNPVTTGVSKEDGSIEFGTISYNLSEVGTHTYYIQEDSKTTVSGIINTATGVIATVIVSNAGDGTLTAQATYMDSKGKKLTEASFTNSASSVSLRKTDSENNLLAGAVLQIVDPAGNVVTTITSEDKSASVVYGLETDTTYTLHEISAPEGYELAKDISFMIGIDNQTYILSGSSKKAADVIVMVDELTDVPEEDTHTPDNTDTPGSTTGDGSNTQETPTTGDDSNIPFAMLLLMLSLVVVAGLCSKKRII